VSPRAGWSEVRMQLGINGPDVSIAAYGKANSSGAPGTGPLQVAVSARPPGAWEVELLSQRVRGPGPHL